MDLKNANDILIEVLSDVKGLKKICRLNDNDYPVILEKEREAEERSLMGLGKVVNTGVREILKNEIVLAALTTMEFDWGPYSTLVLKKGSEIVGEEVRDEKVISELSKDKNVWFLHRNFVVYKDKISFPHDIMKKTCYFEIPSLPAKFCILDESVLHCRSINYANPSTLCDLFIKAQYFDGEDEQGLGTILIGADLDHSGSG
jgi:hypothetical protein